MSKVRVDTISTLDDQFHVDVLDLMHVIEDGSIRRDLANPDMGAAMVAYGEGTVADTLDSQSASIENIINNYSTEPAGTALRSTIEHGFRDVAVLAVGDSTGVGEDKFVGICAQKLAEKYPTHSVVLFLWNEAAKSWGSEIPVSAGSGSRTIRIYNGCVSGARASYWTKWAAYLHPGAREFDSVIVNFGLNQSESEQESATLNSIMDLRDRINGHAFDIVPIIQNPDYNIPERTAARVEAQQRVYRSFGLDPVDSFSMFTDLVNNHGGVAAWLPDNIHPNAAGQEKLAEMVFKRLLNSTAAPVFPKSAPTVIPNGNFQRWPNDYVNPLFWSTGRGAVSAFDDGESNRAVKVLGGTESLSGYISVPLYRFQLQKFVGCNYVYISARLRTTGEGADVGVLEVARSGDNETVRSARYAYGEAGVSSPYRWAVLKLPREFFRGQSGIELRVLSGFSSQDNSVIVEQVSLGSGPVPYVSDGTDSSLTYAYPHNIAPVSLPANSSSRQQYDGVLRAVKGINVSITAINGWPLGIIASAWASDTPGRVIVQLSNVTTAAISVPQIKVVTNID